MSQLGLTPPPPTLGTFLKNVLISDISYGVNIANFTKIIEIGTFLKNRDPPLCFQNSQIEIGTFLKNRDPPTRFQKYNVTTAM